MPQYKPQQKHNQDKQKSTLSTRLYDSRGYSRETHCASPLCRVEVLLLSVVRVRALQYRLFRSDGVLYNGVSSTAVTSSTAVEDVEQFQNRP